METSKYLCFLMCVLLVVVASAGFKLGEPGVCEYTRKRNGKSQNRIACCSGWRYRRSSDTCEPQCRNGCTGGQCVAPDVCECPQHLILNEHNACIQPECTPTCFNAICTASNTCTCNEGFIRHNSTHCAEQCLKGYYNDPIDLNCQFKCQKNCTNGICTAPDTCSCFEGFKLSTEDKFSCIPKCKQSCENSDCVAPDICLCRDGFVKETNWTCKPVCDNCKNGVCIPPNECICKDGYTKSENGGCVPVCNVECTNGFCSEPNVCTCHLGYEKNATNIYDCLPICNPMCINASCESPNKCSCHPGYESTTDNWICKPKCALCSNGRCVGPDKCECNEGYNLTDGLCSPVCKKPCENGVCSSPGVCTCSEGYVMNTTHQSECYKPCNSSCDMGTCSKEGECICNSGFVLENNECISMRPIECVTCNSNCTEGPCWCADGRPCVYMAVNNEMSSSPRDTATLTWVFGAILGVLMLSLIIVIQWIWHKQKKNNQKTTTTTNNDKLYDSVVYTIPNTLMRRPIADEAISEDPDDEEHPDNEVEADEAQWPSERLLQNEISAENMT